jgi:hypothetical protein
MAEIMDKKSLQEFQKFLTAVSEEIKSQKKPLEESIEIPETTKISSVKEDTSIDQMAKYFSSPQKVASSSKETMMIEEAPIIPQNIEAQRWNDPIATPDQKFVTVKDMNDHYNLFLKRIQQQLASLGGGGEVNFRYLDDVNRFTMTDGNNNHVLEYDAATGKVQFTSDIGPIQTLWFDPEHVDARDDVGLLNWNKEDDTLNLHHPNGVTQQIGQELYAYVRNRTGVTIPNGTVVRFAGAEQNGTARLLVAPFQANGQFPNLYGLGITTEDILDGADGFVNVWGKLRTIDTSAWNVGDILYVSPTTPGAMTNVKPTAPNNVMPVAAVLRKDATQGEIFVRPTIEQRSPYGSFSDNQNHTAALINTPYAIPINTTEFADGVIRDPNDVTRIVVQQSGLYNFQFSTQFVSSNSSGKNIYIWARKNGVDIPDSSSIITIVGNGVYSVAAWNFVISMGANDYFQLMWATSDTTASIVAPPSTAFSPSIPSTLLTVTLVAQ